MTLAGSGRVHDIVHRNILLRLSSISVKFPVASSGRRRQISSKIATARIAGAASSIGTISPSHTPAGGSGRRRPRDLFFCDGNRGSASIRYAVAVETRRKAPPYRLTRGIHRIVTPQRPEMAYRMRRTHQRRQTATPSHPLPIQGLRRNGPLGRPRCHRRQCRQHRSRYGKADGPLIAPAHQSRQARRSPRRVLRCQTSRPQCRKHQFCAG